MQSLSLKFGFNRLKLSVLGLLCLIVTPSQAVSIQEIRSPGGIEAWLVQDKSVPVISLKFAFKTGGTAYDPQGKEGLARMVAAMLDEGAGTLNSQAFQKQIQGVAARAAGWITQSRPSDWRRELWEAATSTELASATWMAVEMLATWWVRKALEEARPSP